MEYGIKDGSSLASTDDIDCQSVRFVVTIPRCPVGLFRALFSLSAGLSSLLIFTLNTGPLTAVHCLGLLPSKVS